ncbi:hypothetical protein KSU1_C1532 [Candidatus Jettenia caeni]|uniref:Uncharacterized protein n=1 Tax=Candidatus Jettenia caeni TaxID=247490 RepID=I3IN33_9BACT|nr:hypothetical protein KSU1_C1532 [Candidatus Jettenia caeni]
MLGREIKANLLEQDNLIGRKLLGITCDEIALSILIRMSCQNVGMLRQGLSKRISE